MAGRTKGSSFLMWKQCTMAPRVKAPAARGTAVTTSKEIHSPQG